MVLSTGIRTLDRAFGGGSPAGSLVVLTAPPQSQVGPLLHAGLGERPTNYFTTVRDPEAVRTELDRLSVEPRIRTMRTIGVGNAVENLLAGIEDLGPGENVVVTVLDPLEITATLEEFIAVIGYLIERLQETGGLGILHCLDTYSPPPNRAFTLAGADFVWQLRCQRHKKKLQYTLEIPKAGGLTLSDENRVLALNLGRTVTIDTSRDI